MIKLQTRFTYVQFIVSLSFFIEAIDSTIINTAIPTISNSLHLNPIDLKAALISYFLSLAIFIPISGWLADKLGPKKVFLGALVIFTLGSLWCGFATDLTELTTARFIQGLGGAFGLPIGRLMIIRIMGREHLILAMNKIVMIGALGMMLGPFLGGLITYYCSWPWIFWVNVPIGIGTILLAYFKLPKLEPRPIHPLDKQGFILYGSSLAGFTWGLSLLSESNFQQLTGVIFICLASLVMALYLLHSRKQQYPIVNPELFRVRTFHVAVIGNLISRLGLNSTPFLVPILLQIGLHYSAIESGFVLVPVALGILVTRPVFLPLLRIIGYKIFLIINAIISGLSIWAFTYVTDTTPPYVVGAILFLSGAIMSLQYSALNSLAYSDLTPEDLSAASSIMSTVQQLSQSFAVAIGALIMYLFLLLTSNRTLTMPVLHYTFYTVGCFSLLSALVFLRLKKEDGYQLLHPITKFVPFPHRE